MFEVIRNITVPTGNILIINGEHGPLECLSIGDYGKDVNLTERPVEHVGIMPLSEKWVVTISSQYGCSMGCKFCDVPKVGPGRNASYADMRAQVMRAMELHPDALDRVEKGKRLNVHFARMGEPTFNPDVLTAARWLWAEYGHSFETVHPVVSTLMPRNNAWLYEFLQAWMQIKNVFYGGEAGLQLSINSTSDSERAEMFNGNTLSLREIGVMMTRLPWPVGRKITLNFAVADYEIDPDVLFRWFDPEKFIIKLTPMHKTATALEHGIETSGNYTEPYPYKHHAEALREAGYDVLVFIASREEDEGRITCGNAILAGTEPFGAGVVAPSEGKGGRTL
jgi:23S rRNA (adenine2503-C2)-methyltransferase